MVIDFSRLPWAVAKRAVLPPGLRTTTAPPITPPSSSPMNTEQDPASPPLPLMSCLYTSYPSCKATEGRCPCPNHSGLCSPLYACVTPQMGSMSLGTCCAPILFAVTTTEHRRHLQPNLPYFSIHRGRRGTAPRIDFCLHTVKPSRNTKPD